MGLPGGVLAAVHLLLFACLVQSHDDQSAQNSYPEITLQPRRVRFK